MQLRPLFCCKHLFALKTIDGIQLDFVFLQIGIYLIIVAQNYPMKIKFLLFLILIVFVSCNSKKEFTYEIRGKFIPSITDSLQKPQIPHFIYLKELDSAGVFQIADSCRLAPDGTFSFTDTISQTKSFQIAYLGKTTPLFIDAADLVMEVELYDDPRRNLVTGSPSQWLCNEFVQLVRRRDAAVDSLQNNASLSKTEFEKSRQDTISKYQELMLQRVKRYDESLVCSWFINEYVEPENCAAFLKTLDESLQTVPFYNEINAKIDQFQHDKSLLAKVEIGKKLESVALPDSVGQTYSIRALRGNYVLVNLWSIHSDAVEYELSRYQNIYDNYQNLGFRIYGISVDTNKQQWISMLQRLNPTWTNVNDLKGEESPLCEKIPFHLKGVPYNLLLDPEGVIIAENIKGEALIVTLDSLLRP